MLALITGASRGIGLETARTLASRKVDVIAVSRSDSSYKESQFVHPVKADVRTEEGWREIRMALQMMGKPLDVVIHNAAAVLRKDFQEIKLNELNELFHANFFTPFLLTQKLLDHLNPSGSHIIFISSMGGFQGSSKFSGLSAYSSSKAALACLS